MSDETRDVGDELMVQASAASLQQPKLKHGEYPGAINFADVRGNWPGCKLEVFTGGSDNELHRWVTAQEAFNLFFERNRGLLVAHVEPCIVPQVGGDTFAILCLYTKIVSPEELAENEEAQSELRVIMEKRREAKAAHQAKVAEQVDAQQKEILRLAEVGRKFEASQQQAPTITPLGEVGRGKKKGGR